MSLQIRKFKICFLHIGQLYHSSNRYDIIDASNYYNLFYVEDYNMQKRSGILNYIGSKLSLIDFLVDSIEQVTNTNEGVFADLFAGTGIVGATFRTKGFNVIANDIQYYSYVLNKHYTN